jgi:hypothetical protein
MPPAIPILAAAALGGAGAWAGAGFAITTAALTSIAVTASISAALAPMAMLISPPQSSAKR